MKYIALLLCLVTLAASVMAEESKDPVEVLKEANQLESGHLGYAGEPSKLNAAFDKIYARKTALADFGVIFVQAKTDEAKIYALTGIHELDLKHYQRLSILLDGNKVIGTQNGCLKGDITIEKCLKKIECGELFKMIHGETGETVTK